ncbi:MAG TPA: MFS transporter [Solirubrobacteraceae bacterium]|nr:MFS transporter [Solirubrobacteraceae bacterium]
MQNLENPLSAEPAAPREPRGLARLLAVAGSPQARGLLAARGIGSLPVGMVPLGIILLLRALGDSYALAGVADGAYAVGVAIMQPPLGRLIDRFGMTRVLAPLAIVFPATVVAFAFAASAGAPAAVTVALALLSGAALPPLGACMRVLWPRLISSESLRPTAFAIDATLQELPFIAGPPLLALIVAIASPKAALLAAAAAGGAGTAAFVALARRHRVQTARAGGALRSAGVRRVLALSFLLGGGFGATEVAMPAFCELHGARPAAGLLLAALALGSGCGGLIFGARAARIPPARRLLVALCGYSLLVVPLLAAPSIPLMALCIFVSGLPIAPAFAGSYLLLDRFSVPGALTETFAWNTTAIFVGASLGTAGGGVLIAPASYRASIAVSVVLGFACAMLVAGYARNAHLES